MKQAAITPIQVGGRRLTNIAIEEVGAFTLPASVLQGRSVRASVLDVIDISLDRHSDQWVLEAIGNIVTTELMADDVRLEVRPKVSFDALYRLIQWANRFVDVLEDQNLSVKFADQVGLYDAFVQAFLDALQGVLQKGWLPAMERRAIVSDSLSGHIEPIRSVEHIYTRMEVAFHQIVNRMTFDVAANRVLRTALLGVAQSRYRIDSTLVDKACAILASMPQVRSFDDTRQAIDACEYILKWRRVDLSRSYYYAALRASLLILRATARADGGNVEFEDVPMRIAMPDTFEAAVRNVAAWGLARTHAVLKGTGDRRVYSDSSDDSFNPALEPDILIHPLGMPYNFAAIFDAKYKDKPSPSDHYQLATYVAAYDVPLAGFITVTENPEEAGVRRIARLNEKTTIVEYAIYPGMLTQSMRGYVEWLRHTLRT